MTSKTLTLDATNTARARQARTNDAPVWLTLDPCLHCKPRPPFDERPACVCGLVDLIALTEPDCPKLLTLQGECPECGGSATHWNSAGGAAFTSRCWACRDGIVDLGEWRVEQVVPIWTIEDEDAQESSYYGPARVVIHPSGSARYWPAWDGAQEWDEGTDIELGPNHEQHIGKYAYRVVPT